MYPARRGGNNSPGYWEGFYGEVDDVLAAARYLSTQPFVDAKRIYLGGHSTGGTLALLVAAMPNQFRGIFSFGPVDDVRGYGTEELPFDTTDNMEVAMRAPFLWLKDIRRPTFVFEGTGGNIESLHTLSRRNSNANVRFYGVRGADHFNILAPTTRLIAQKITRDTGARPRITFSQSELNAPFRRR
jgi:acetyl esterase/lipase